MAKSSSAETRKRELIREMLSQYEVKDLNDIGEMLKDMFGSTIQGMLESEMDQHLGYAKHERSENGDSRNGFSKKTVNTTLGKIDLKIPRDRDGEFEPKVVAKRQTDVSGIEEKVISMYAKGMTTRDIAAHLEDIYGVDASPELISSITDKILPEAREWQARPLEEKQVILYLDAIHYSVRCDGSVSKKAVYVAIGLGASGRKEVLGLYIGGSESSKFWLSVLNDLKRRGVKDVMIACVDGLSGFAEAIAEVFPDADVQRCIVHQMRNSLKFVASRDMRAVAADLKRIYASPTMDSAHAELEAFEEKWNAKYPRIGASWENSWSELTTFYAYPPEIRRLIYTTNAIEGFNRQLRKVTKTRSSFPTEDSLFKLIYLAMKDITKKWTGVPRGWNMIFRQLLIMFPDRLSEDDLPPRA